MDELVQQVSTRTGLPADQSRQAVETVIGFLKDRLPAPIAGQLDGVLAGGSSGGAGGAGGMMDSAKGALGGMFGGGDKPQ